MQCWPLQGFAVGSPGHFPSGKPAMTVATHSISLPVFKGTSPLKTFFVQQVEEMNMETWKQAF